MGTNENKEITREADLQGITYLGDFDDQMIFVHVDDDRNPREKQSFTGTEYVYGYWLKVTNDTEIINEAGEELTLEEISVRYIEAWVKEEFVEERTVANIYEISLEEEGRTLFPIYTAEKIKHVEVVRTKEDVIEQLKSYEEGKYTLHLFFDSMESHNDRVDEANEVMDIISDLETIETGFVSTGAEGPPENAKLLGIEEYPSYVIFNTRDVVLITSNLDEVKEFFGLEVEE